MNRTFADLAADVAALRAELDLLNPCPWRPYGGWTAARNAITVRTIR